MTADTKYHYERNDDGYETLLRPDGTDVTTITEPEDRTFGRDLSAVIRELNALLARLAEAERERDEMEGVLIEASEDIAGVTPADTIRRVLRARDLAQKRLGEAVEIISRIAQHDERIEGAQATAVLRGDIEKARAFMTPTPGGTGGA